MRVLMMIHRQADNSPYCFYVHEQAKALRAQGHEVTVISCVGVMPMMQKLRPALAETDRRTPKKDVIDGIPVYFPRCLTLGNVGEKAIGGWLLYRAALPIAKALHREKPFDIVHAHMLPRDGHAGLLLARALVMAFNAKPIIVCPADSVQAIEKCAAVVGLHIYEDLDTVQELPLSMGVVAFTKDKAAAPPQAEALAARKPAAVISVEASGANAQGVYHNAVGMDVTELQAKSEALWNLLREQGVPNIAIGDLGNEIGMGTIAAHIRKYVPFTDAGECKCGCGGGILSATAADNIITATCSDWGCYGLMAALAYLKKDMEILHHEEMESEVMRVAARSGFIDMTGSLLPGIDGFSTRMNVGIVSLMRQCTAYAVRFSHNSDHWFSPVLAKHFFD